ncbi:ABC transporter substrate-binding protein [Paenibacillus sp. strain BS8-2]
MNMNIDAHIWAWNVSSIKLTDIRYKELDFGEALQQYRLPANAFLYVRKGKAKVRLGGQLHMADKNFVLHSGSGDTLDIWPEESFAYYLILYQASLLLPPSQYVEKRLYDINPFRSTFSLIAGKPLLVNELVASMHMDWLIAAPLEQFRARGLFYQFVHELYAQMKREGIQTSNPDLLEQVLRYMHDCYKEPLSLENIAERFGCSVSYLVKLFKKRLGESPIRYLNAIRMETAAKLLVESEASFQDISEFVGIQDAHTLSRSFRKYYGMGPSQFKHSYPTVPSISELPGRRTRIALVEKDSRCYSVNISEKHSHWQRSGGNFVYHARKSASMTTAALLLCVVLLLGACSAGGNNSTGGNGAPSSNVSEQVEKTTRTYQDGKGVVTIPAEPKRIVDLTGSYIGNLLKLGIKPVGVTSDALENPYHEGMLGETVDIGDGTNLEALLEVNPDLIIAFDYIDAAYYEKLKEIAPVVRFSYGKDSPAELFLKYGEVTGKDQEAAAWFEQWNAKLAEVKPKIAEVVGDKKVSILQPYAKGIYVWGNKGGRGGEILYNDLGLKAPEPIQSTLIEGNEFNGDISLEKINEYAGDFIFTSNWGGDDGDPDVLYGSNLWKSLPAVKSNQVYFIDQKAAYYSDAISLDKHLAFIMESFLGKQP